MVLGRGPLAHACRALIGIAERRELTGGDGVIDLDAVGGKRRS